jgi:hypothetical protein
MSSAIILMKTIALEKRSCNNKIHLQKRISSAIFFH